MANEKTELQEVSEKLQELEVQNQEPFNTPRFTVNGQQIF